jgi:hypothetical protein
MFLQNLQCQRYVQFTHVNGQASSVVFLIFSLL